MASSYSSTLFKASAFMFAAILVPGHVLFGINNVHKAISRAESKDGLLNKEERRGLVGARNAWDNWNPAALAFAFLNYQWARTNGPKTQEETLALAVLAGGNFITGVRYGLKGEAGPAVFLVIASATSALGYLLV